MRVDRDDVSGTGVRGVELVAAEAYELPLRSANPLAMVVGTGGGM
jgi:hypothetical protein